MIIVPPLTYKAIAEQYPHLADQFEPYQHIYPSRTSDEPPTQ